MTENDIAVMKALGEVQDFYKPKTQIFPIIMIIIISIVLCYLYTHEVRPRIEANCNARGGSYLGGHCIIY